MAYDGFIKTLNKGIEGRILAYDEREDGLYLLVRDGLTKIVVDKMVLDDHADEAIFELKRFIRSGNCETGQLAVVLRDGELAFEAAEMETA